MTVADPAPSPAAERSRRLRQRRKTGVVLVAIPVSAAAIDRLVALGWLDPDHRRDAIAVRHALCNIAGTALGAGLRNA